MADFHHDYIYDGYYNRVRVHRTVSGNGEVLLGNSGLLGADLDLFARGLRSTTSLHERQRDLEQQVNPLLNQFGEVDKRMVNPNLYAAEIALDDIVVFPLCMPANESHEKAGPIWHRFNTTTSHRRAIVAEIRKKGK